MFKKRKRKHADHTLLIAMACGSTLENAAMKAGIGHSTAHRRMTDPVFVKRLEETKAGMVQRTAAMLTAAATESVKTLLELQGGVSPAAVRLNAARAIIELGTKLRETAELQQRIAALENQLTGETTPTPPFIPPPPDEPPPDSPSGPGNDGAPALSDDSQSEPAAIALGVAA